MKRQADPLPPCVRVIEDELPGAIGLAPDHFDRFARKRKRVASRRVPGRAPIVIKDGDIAQLGNHSRVGFDVGRLEFGEAAHRFANLIEPNGGGLPRLPRDYRILFIQGNDGFKVGCRHRRFE